MRSSDQFAEDVQPLLGEISWDQRKPYNLYCPEMEGGRAVTGCIATAMAMIMKYYEYPTKGSGSHSYIMPNGITCSFDYGNTTFDWENMLPQYVEGEYNEEQAKAVAELMYACGVSVEMEYSPNGSGSNLIPYYERALIDFFGYNKNLGFAIRKFYSSDEWMDMVKKELNAKRPVLYAGVSTTGGHQFVIDGYDKDNLVHVNWGWGGIANGYFEIASLDNNSPGIDSDSFNGYFMSQQMVLGLQPESGDYTSQFSIGDLTVDKLEAKKGENFKFFSTRYSNISSVFNKGELALIAEDKDGSQFPIFKINIDEPIKIGKGGKILQFEASIPEEFEDGTYRIYMATKEERENKYNKTHSTMGFLIEYVLTVDGESCSLIPLREFQDIENEINIDLDVPEILYTGTTYNLKTKLENISSNSEFYGHIGLILYDKETYEPEIVLGNYFELLIPMDTKKEVEIPIYITGLDYVSETPINIPSGEYLIAPIAYYGEKAYHVGKRKPVTIQQGCKKIKAGNGSLEKSEIGVGETLKLTADLMLDGEGDGFSGDLYSAIFAEGEKGSNNLYTFNISFNKSEQPYKLEVEIPSNVNTPGKYHLNLYMKEGSVKIINKLAFTVSANPTSIEAQPDGTDGLTVYGITDGNSIRIKTSDLAEQVDIFTITGQNVHQEKLTPGVGNIYNLNATNISEGVYIMVVRTSDGKVYRAKFRM